MSDMMATRIVHPVATILHNEPGKCAVERLTLGWRIVDKGDGMRVEMLYRCPSCTPEWTTTETSLRITDGDVISDKVDMMLATWGSSVWGLEVGGE